MIGVLRSFRVKEKGFSLTEILVAFTLLLVFAASIPPMFNVAAKTTQINRAKTIATNLANEEIEKIRNLPYDDVGTNPGNPSGRLNESDDVTASRLVFRITRRVSWVDDPSDELEPNDPLPADYKLARVMVSVPGLPFLKPVTLATYVSRRGEETVGNRGNLKVYVLDANDEPVPGAQIDVISESSAPLRAWTNSEGEILFPALYPDDYSVSAAKNGYISLESTQVAAVTADNTTRVYFHLDRPGEIILNVVDAQGNAVPNANVNLERANLSPKTYSSSDGTFDASGLFPGVWEVTAEAYGYEHKSAVSVEIDRDKSTKVTITLKPKPIGNIHIEVLDSVSREKLDRASVKLTQDETGEVFEYETSSGGILEVPRESGLYKVEVSKDGYLGYVGEVTVDKVGNTNLDVYLEPEPTSGSILIRAESLDGDPMNNVWVRVRGSENSYDQRQETGTYRRGEAAFDNLEPGRYQTDYWSPSRRQWVERRQVSVSAGHTVSVIYSDTGR